MSVAVPHINRITFCVYYDDQLFPDLSPYSVPRDSCCMLVEQWHTHPRPWLRSLVLCGYLLVNLGIESMRSQTEELLLPWSFSPFRCSVLVVRLLARVSLMQPEFLISPFRCGILEV